MIIGVLFILFAYPVSAQDETSSDPEYIVQPGDTLTGIATRFGISLDALSTANQISNPNQLYVGQALVLPGVDWIQGTLDVEQVAFGESFRSLRRRYHLDAETLGRVGGVIVPSQVYAGYPLMLPGGSGEDFSAARAAVPSEGSLLELSTRLGSNPWELAAKNQLAGLWDGIAGDVMLVPNTDDPGPGVLPSPLNISVTKGNFVQGKTTQIEVSAGNQAIQLEGEFLGLPIHFFDEGNGTYVALQGVHVMTEPGPYRLTLIGTIGQDQQFEFSELVSVQSGNYPSESLSVDPVYLDDMVNGEESDLVYSIASVINPEKYWSGLFQHPTPYANKITSKFGTRRSYNKDTYFNFHSGVDFGQYASIEVMQVLSPARGKVVFAGALNIRGNATIIDHGWGIYTGYWHQSEIFVQVGDMVEPGQVIGMVGNTGRSSGAHLHWELWAGGVQVEPLDWLFEVFP